MIDERLELLSQQVRNGIPVGYLEAIEVIEYQERLKQERATSPWKRFMAWLNG